MKAVLVACSLVILQLLVSESALAATSRTLVVDQGDVQCGNAQFTSIGAAIQEAQPGDTVRVCPGLYRETLTIDKTLTVHGLPDVIAAVDCWDAAPSALDDLDPTRQAILDGSLSTDLSMITIAASGVVVEGLVLQGVRNAVPPADFRLIRRAIDTIDDHAGYRIRNNLFRLNSVGVQFGSAGGAESRFDHNCLRDNLWGLATDERNLVDARVDHNVTFRTQNFAFEPAVGFIQNVTFDHNASRQDRTAYLIRNSAGTRIVANTIESTQLGIVVGGGAPNVGLEIAENVIALNAALPVTFPGGVQQGIAFAAPPAGQAPNTTANVRDNTISAMRDGIVAAGPPNATQPALMDSTIASNVVNGHIRDGIVLRGGNAGNTVVGNTASGNGRFGIYAQCSLDGLTCAVDNRFEANTMLGNVVADARDEGLLVNASPPNTWIANVCVTDVPQGAIC